MNSTPAFVTRPSGVGTTISELTRTAIEAHIGAGPRRRLGAAAAGHSGRTDVSERIEEIITAEVGRSR